MGDLSILQHAIGADSYGRVERGERRNHYVQAESDGGLEWAACMEMVDTGLMRRHGPSELYGGPDSYCFVVTEAGREYVREHSPEAPKVSRGKRRYLEWLEVSDATNETFGEWLRRESREVRHA